MKKYITKSLWALMSFTMLFMTSCEDLELAPEDYYGSENFWQTEAQVENYVLGLHKHMRDTYSNIWLLGDARGGLQKNGTSSLNTSLNYSSPIKSQEFTKDNVGIGGWAGIYGKLLNVNLAIYKIENECSFLDDETRNYLLGQVYGIRAWYYFYLHRTWGGVPLILEPKVVLGVNDAQSLYTARSTSKETLSQVKTDVNKSLEKFASNVSMSHQRSTWSKYASLMLKAEVYLWSAKVTTEDQSPAAEDLGMAEAALNEVKGNFSLQSDFASVFAYDNKGNDEIIMALRFVETESTNWMSHFIYAFNLMGAKYAADGTQSSDPLELIGGGTLRNEYIFSFFESFDDLDTRKSATFYDFYDMDATTGDLINGGVVMRKFLGTVNSEGNRRYSDDIPLYRYADVLLMLAEVENAKGNDPSAYLNEVRERAYGTNYDVTLHGYTNQDKAANEIAILHERDKELVYEGARWFDMRRMQDANGKPLAFTDGISYGVPALLDESTEAHKLLWPVDVSTLNDDPLLKQTPGYEED
ncbi:MAG: RagB/SusD family nutrient uptake outer membrane protein [Marinifilum sp.]|nr:RagB/SusD family nutrient uptake outer membrane protein [Marinifilum sp.]